MIPRHRRLLAVLAALLGLIAQPVRAADGLHALLIGIGQYAPAWGAEALPGVAVDMVNARRMARAMGVDERAIVELRDAQATRDRITAELRRLGERVRPGDRVLIYFSGHGTRAEVAGTCREGLATWSGEMITEAELAALTRPLAERADKLITIIDACFSGGLLRAGTRGVTGEEPLRARFVARGAQACVQPVNEPRATRSLLGELGRLGVREENVVQIAAADYNEVSWDDRELGGLATHAISRCLLGEARDLNASGAISLDEIRACAQVRLDERMRAHRDKGMLPSTIQVRGNRNLVVVATPPIAAAGVDVQAAPAPAPTPTPTPAPAPALAPALAPAPAPEVVATPPLAGPRATLDDVARQADPRRRPQVRAAQTLRIGRDPFSFTLASPVDGFLYVVMLGSDERSLYLLFPNRLDADNRVRAGRPQTLPRPGWQVNAGGPEGTNRVLFVVTPSALDASVFGPPDAGGGPFTWSVADLAASHRLVDMFLGRGRQGRDRGYGAELLDIRELP